MAVVRNDFVLSDSITYPHVYEDLLTKLRAAHPEYTSNPTYGLTVVHAGAKTLAFRAEDVLRSVKNSRGIDPLITSTVGQNVIRAQQCEARLRTPGHLRALERFLLRLPEHIMKDAVDNLINGHGVFVRDPSGQWAEGSTNIPLVVVHRAVALAEEFAQFIMMLWQEQEKEGLPRAVVYTHNGTDSTLTKLKRRDLAAFA